MPEEVLSQLHSLKKGDLLTVAQLAAIGGAKKTSDLVPLCHQVELDRVQVLVEIQSGCVRVHCTAKASEARTGVEMEALVGASLGALAVYDMCKSVSHDMRIQVRLLHKSGGKRRFDASD